MSTSTRTLPPTTRPLTATVAAAAPSLRSPLSGRRSTRAFHRSPLAAEDVHAMLEAARWAPSAMNAQPWHFVVGLVGDRTHDDLTAALAEGNRGWAYRAPVLVLAAAREIDDTGSARPIAGYELGLSVAAMEAEAHARGLVTHQMGGFDRAAASRILADLGVAPGHTPYVVLAVGRPGDVRDLAEPWRARETADRTRRALRDIVSGASWPTPYTGGTATRGAHGTAA